MADQTVTMRWRRTSETDADALVRRTRCHIFHIAVKVTGSRDLAEDVTQDVCLRLTKNAHKVSTENTAAWIRKTTVRRCLSALREKANISPSKPTTADDPTQDIAVRDTLFRLRPEARTLLGLALGLGYSYEEIAEILEVPVGTVASRLHAAKQAFRNAWEEAK